MKFKISAKQFVKYITPAAEIALKNVKKLEIDGRKTDSRNANRISIDATPEELIINAHGGSAIIEIKLKRCDGYVFVEEGGITVRAKELVPVLKSFRQFDDLFISVEEWHLKVALESDKDNCILVPGLSELLPHPAIPKKYKQQVIVDKTYFVEGLEKVAYAQAFEKKMYSYMCVLFESSDNKIRFSAGSGGRFAVVEYDSDTKKITSNEMKVIFPKPRVSNIINIFKKTACSTIKITAYDSKGSIPDQIVFETDNIVVSIYDLESFTKYPDLSKIINYNRSYQISTRLKDWEYIAKAITASKPKYKENIHNIKATADFLNEHFDIETDSDLRINKRVYFAQETYVTDPNKEKNYKPWFCANSLYLEEITNKSWKKNEVVIFNFNCQSKLDLIPDDKSKQMEPILLKFPEKTNKDGVREKAFVLFTVSSKEFDSKG